MIGIMSKLFYNLIHYYTIIFHRKAIPRFICKLQSGQRRAIASARKSTNQNNLHHCKFGRCELDSHADTIVAGSNCVVLSFTGKECDVSPFTDDYDSISNVPIVHAATAWQSSSRGQTYILVLNEALWMGDTMDHTLINPNQLRHYGTKVRDDPTSNHPLSIITESNEFCMGLQMAGTICYAETHSPTAQELENCPSHPIILRI